MKKFISMLLALTMILSITACSPKSPASAPSADQALGDQEAKPAKDTMTVAISIDPGSLNPYDRLENIGRQLWSPVYESLFIYGKGDLHPEPVLVDTYEFSEDQKELTLHLKQGVKFHNGQEMKASDVVYSFDVIHKKSPGHMGDIDWDNIKALDDYTVFIPYNSVQGPTLYYLCNLYVLSEKYMTSIPEEEWSVNCIGTGPYKWGDFIENSEYNLVRFDDYRDPKPLSKIVVRIIPDSNVQKIEMETGGVDLACGLQFSDLAAFAGNTGDGIMVAPSDTIAMLELIHCFPGGEGPLADVRVRQAVSYAIDRQAVNKVVFNGLGAAATAIYPSGIMAYTPAENQRGYSVEKARELLAEAGYSDGVTIDFYCQNTAMFQALADVMTGMCQEVGITLNVIMSDFATMSGYMGTGENPGIYTLRQYANGDPYILLNYFFGEDMFLYASSGFNTDEKIQDVYKLRKEALQLVDQSERNNVYHKIMQIVYDRVYYDSLIEYADQVAYGEKLKGFWMAGPVYHYEDCYFD